MSIEHLMINNINKYTFMNALDDYVETFLKKNSSTTPATSTTKSTTLTITSITTTNLTSTSTIKSASTRSSRLC